MQADSSAPGNLIEYWTAGIRRGFNIVILIVLLLIVSAQVRVFVAIAAAVSPESSNGRWYLARVIGERVMPLILSHDGGRTSVFMPEVRL